LNYLLFPITPSNQSPLFRRFVLMKFSRLTPILILFLTAGNLLAQKLDFIGLNGIYFGMKSTELASKTIILDSTSIYKDTALYLRNTRCQSYFRKGENLQLTGFTASAIEYQFCDDELSYVFIHVKGEDEITKAVAQLQLTFHKLGCKGKDISKCTQMDSSAKGMRLIINIDHKKHLMDFVLIPKQNAK
jgi:hypothetical protein